MPNNVYRIKMSLLCSNHSLRISLSIIGAKYFCQAKIRNFRVHVLVQENVAGFKIPVYNPQPRVLVQVQKTLRYPFNYGTTFIPIK